MQQADPRTGNVKIHIVAGPTASGKSAYAMDLARRIQGVIINCDSMQMYDDLPILTAQPSESDMAAIPHRLYGALHPNDACSAGNWREIALPVIEGVLSKGQTPIVCGGTGLYIKALVDGLSPIPDIPPEVRARAVAMQRDWDAPAFYEYLLERDPVMAQRLGPNNRARLVRAWEVLEATGRSLAEWQSLKREGPPSHWRFEIHKILPERETLYERCNARLLSMIKNGALEEVRTFQRRIEAGNIRPDVPLAKALGLRPLLAHLAGELSLHEAITRAQGETRRYAKRQVTWFRHQL